MNRPIVIAALGIALGYVVSSTVSALYAGLHSPVIAGGICIVALTVLLCIACQPKEAEE